MFSRPSEHKHFSVTLTDSTRSSEHLTWPLRDSSCSTSRSLSPCPSSSCRFKLSSFPCSFLRANSFSSSLPCASSSFRANSFFSLSARVNCSRNCSALKWFEQVKLLCKVFFVEKILLRLRLFLYRSKTILAYNSVFRKCKCTLHSYINASIPVIYEIFHILNCGSAVQCMKYFINHFTFILHGLIRTHKWPAPNVSGFIAQLVRASHQYREVTGSNPVEVLTFSGFSTQLLKLPS